MIKFRYIIVALIVAVMVSSCGDKDTDTPPPTTPPPVNFSLTSWSVNSVSSQANNYNVNKTPVIRFRFPVPINRSTVVPNVQFRDNSANAVPFNVTYENADSIVVVQPSSPLNNLSRYTVTLADQLKSVAGKGYSVPSRV